MKSLITIIALFITTFVSAQTKLDSLVFVKVNEYRISLGLNKVEFDNICYKSAENQASYLFKNDSIGHSQNNIGFETPNKRYIYFGGNEHASTAEVSNSVGKINLEDNDTMKLDKLATKVLDAWKSSEYHNAILISPKYKFAGVSTKVKTRSAGKKNWTNYVIKGVMVFTTMK